MKCGYGNCVGARWRKLSNDMACSVPRQRSGRGRLGRGDSVCLLEVMRELACAVGVAPGRAAPRSRVARRRVAEDAEFVRGLAGRMELPFILDRAELGSGGRQPGGGGAGGAFAVLFASKSRLVQWDLVALGHTRSDQAETVLFVSARLGYGRPGGHSTGDAATASVRPLLERHTRRPRRSCAREALHGGRIRPNASARFARNRIRHSFAAAGGSGIRRLRKRLPKTPTGRWPRRRYGRRNARLAARMPAPTMAPP